MPVKAHLRFAAATDPGRRRKNNEDRYYVDPDRGIYAVIDGVGGHAAGETAAGVAVDVIRERLERDSGTPEERIREAITLANNEIFRLSRARTEWAGMACVLTVALVEDDIVTVGHVGDSRLYLIRRGEMQKMTHDHSPVGEREDRGEISEAEAMRHSRRNEIFRDVGSGERSPDDPGFIELLSFPMPSDGVLLLCSDGLTDLVPSAEVRAGIERYAPDFEMAARALIAAANDAGGKDNITVVIVAGADFGDMAPVSDKVVSEHSTGSRWGIFLLVGLALGLIAGLFTGFLWNRITENGPRTVVVGTNGIRAAMAQARDGDTVLIPEGRYRERVTLRPNVMLRAQNAGTVTLTSPDGGPVVNASRIYTGGIEGVWIQGDLDAPASVGIEIDNASPLVSDVKITGAANGIDVRGTSMPVIRASQVTNNKGAGIVVDADATPRIENTIIAANGNGEGGAVRPGVEILEKAHPVLRNNAIVDNGAEAIWVHGSANKPQDFEDNFFGGLDPDEAVLVTGAKPAAEPAKNKTSNTAAPKLARQKAEQPKPDQPKPKQAKSDDAKSGPPKSDQPKAAPKKAPDTQ